MARQRLTVDVITRIVVLLACYERPSVIRRTLKEEFGLDVPVTTIVYYNPDTRGTEVAKRWVKLFEKVRAQYIKDAGRVPIMNQAYRARMLQRVLELEEDRENTVGMRDTLKQAAEEQGGAFTNKRELTGANGAPIPMSLTVNFVRPGDPPADQSGESKGDGQRG